MKKKAKSRRETGEIKPKKALEPPIEDLAQPIETIFDDGPVEIPTVPQTLFDDEPPPVTLPPSQIIAVERDMTPDQRAQFESLLSEKMTLEERASQLVRLAHLKGSKTAAVGLRAIMEINRITRVSEPRPSEAPAMFQLPEGVSVSVNIEKVEQ